MKRNAIVVANWKMNGNLAFINTMAEHLNSLNIQSNVKVLLSPSSPYLQFAERTFKHQQISICAQNMSEFNSGAHTGEISAEMLNDLAVNYVILGHSERRSLYQETSALVAKKVKTALAAGLKPILCIGETETERAAGQTEKKLTSQLQAVIDVVGIAGFENVIVSYEPLWAIGTGNTASPEMAQETHRFIRGFLAQFNSDIAIKLPILYGGSVNGSNFKELFAQPDIDGALIGGASLKVDEFSMICSTVKG